MDMHRQHCNCNLSSITTLDASAWTAPCKTCVGTAGTIYQFLYHHQLRPWLRVGEEIVVKHFPPFIRNVREMLKMHPTVDGRENKTNYSVLFWVSPSSSAVASLLVLMLMLRYKRCHSCVAKICKSPECSDHTVSESASAQMKKGSTFTLLWSSSLVIP